MYVSMRQCHVCLYIVLFGLMAWSSGAEETVPTEVVPPIERQLCLFYELTDDAAMSGQRIEVPDVLETTSNPTFSYQENSFVFHFGCDDVAEHETFLYKVWMDGLYDEWSPWFRQNFVHYEDLKEGTYSFHVVGKNNHGESIAAPVFTFVVQPPWYRQRAAFVIYSLTGIACLVGFGFFIGISAHRMKQNKELLELNATKNKLFSIIAHDLRAPIGSLKDGMELIRDELINGDTEAALELINLLKKSSESSYILLDNLLSWSKSQLNALMVEKESFDLTAAIANTVDLMKSACYQKKVDVHFDDSHEMYVCADRQMITLVIRNILSNAIKFTPSEKGIEIHIAQENNQCVVHVKDHGVGIEKNRCALLFDFTEVKSTRGTDGEVGTGLGLVLCNDFIRMNGGKLWINSTVGKGSTFSFSLPLC